TSPFFFNDTPTTEIYTTRLTLSLHDALPIYLRDLLGVAHAQHRHEVPLAGRSEEHTSELQSRLVISYAVFCLKKKMKREQAIYGSLKLQFYFFLVYNVLI